MAFNAPKKYHSYKKLVVYFNTNCSFSYKKELSILETHNRIMCLYLALSKVQTENIVEYIVRTVLGNQMESLREHLRVAFIINLESFVSNLNNQQNPANLAYQKLTSN